MNVDAVLLFNALESVPDNTNILETLVQALASNSSDFFGLYINASSITSERKTL